jgi:hypothetical protein
LARYRAYREGKIIPFGLNLDALPRGQPNDISLDTFYLWYIIQKRLRIADLVHQVSDQTRSNLS